MTRKQNEEFKQKLRDMKVDAVISGNGGCGQGQINEEANVAIGRFMNLALMNLCGED